MAGREGVKQVRQAGRWAGYLPSSKERQKLTWAVRTFGHLKCSLYKRKLFSDLIYCILVPSLVGTSKSERNRPWYKCFQFGYVKAEGPQSAISFWACDVTGRVGIGSCRTATKKGTLNCYRDPYVPGPYVCVCIHACVCKEEGNVQNKKK